MDSAGETGFFGKLPSHGDFISGRLPRRLIECWDAWIRPSIVRSEELLGEEEWNARYLVAPIWRFFWSSGVCGDRPWLGLFMPSVDSGGRSYPMMVAASLDREIVLHRALEGSKEWFERLEQILLSSLEDDIDLDDFNALVHRQALELGVGSQDEGEGDTPGVLVTTGRDVLETLDGLPWAGVAQECAVFTLWWAVRQEGECPVLFSRGLPPPGDFLGFLPDRNGVLDQSIKKAQVPE